MRLVIDGSLRELRLALYDGGQCLAYKEILGAKAEIFPQLLVEALGENSRKIAEISEVIVHRGPGSFTGVRTAMAFASSLCFQKQRRLKTINTLVSLGLNLKTGGLVLLSAYPKMWYAARVEANGIDSNQIWLMKEDEINALNDTAVLAPRSFLDQYQLIGIPWEEVQKNGRAWFNLVNAQGDRLRAVDSNSASIDYVQAPSAVKNLTKPQS